MYRDNSDLFNKICDSMLNENDLDTALLLHKYVRLGSLDWKGNFTGDTLVILAARHDCLVGLSLLIEYGADTNISDNFGKTALMYATRSNSLECMKMLLNAGADLYIKDALREQTALDYAIKHNHPDSIKLLRTHMLNKSKGVLSDV